MILFTYGTRPEYIKIKSLLDHSAGISHRVLFTGQHKDLCNHHNDWIIEIENGPNRLDSIICSLLNQPDILFKDITHVLVQGDTTSAMAIAMAAFNRNIPVIHLEAGLRTNDINDPWPEEFNRQVISKIAEIHLCPTEQNKENLLKENVKGKIYVTGNTGLDNIPKKEITYNNDIIVTLHRRENHPFIPFLFEQVNELAKENKDLNFILPIHPNPNVSKHRDILTDVNVIASVSHTEMIDMVSKCRFLVSDSGGLQEEASFLNKKIIVCRKTTERPESISIHSILCDDYIKLKQLFYSIKDNYYINHPCPFGDGKAYERIVPILKHL